VVLKSEKLDLLVVDKTIGLDFLGISRVHGHDPLVLLNSIHLEIRFLLFFLCLQLIYHEMTSSNIICRGLPGRIIVEGKRDMLLFESLAMRIPSPLTIYIYLLHSIIL